MTVALHHRAQGPPGAPALVLGGSLGTTSDIWHEAVPALAGPLRAIAYDHRGHGRSPAPPGPYSMADLSRDVVALLDRLVICCSSAYLPPREEWTERAQTVRAHGLEAIADRLIDRWFTPAARAARPELIERTRRGLLAGSPAGYAACCEAIADYDLRDRLRDVRAPTLVIAAADDPATPPEHGREIAGRIPGARLVVLEQGRHLVAAERPREIARLVLEHVTAGAGT